MRHIDLSVPFSSAGAESAQISAEVIQVDTGAGVASLGDLNQMVARAAAGRSARDYMLECCPAAAVKKDILTVTLEVMVYPSDLDLAYSLAADWGNLSPGRLVRKARRLNIIFDGTSSITMDFFFQGEFIAAMPFFDQAGARIRVPAIVQDGLQLNLAQPVYGVFRAIGDSVGYLHIVTMLLQIQSGIKISDLNNAVTLTYIDGAGKLTAKKLDLKIPQCVADLLALCDNGEPKIGGSPNEPDLVPVIYYSDCSGEIIEIRYEK